MMNLFSGRPAWAAYFVLSLVILISSCEKPEESLGLELLPEENLLGIHTYTDSLLLHTYTVSADSARTNELSRALLGELFIMDFGPSQSNIYTQVRLSALSVDFADGGNPDLVVLDSLVLSLEYLDADSLYGVEEPMLFSVKQLTEDLDLDSLYYSNDMSAVGEELLHMNVPALTPAPADSVELFGLKYPPQLRLRLKDEFGDQLIEEAKNGSSFDDVSDFIEYIKGFRISAERESGMGTGAILGLNLLAAQSKLTLYYQNEQEDSLSFDFVINESAQRYLEFTHDYSNTPVQTVLDDPGTQETQLYLQSMAGVNVWVDMPAIIGLTDTLQSAINKVELVLPVADPMMNEAFFPTRLFAVYRNEDGAPISIPDIFEGDIHSDGRYDAEAGEYRINITRFAQQVATGVIDQPSLQILPISNAITAQSVRLNGVGNMAGGAKLVVTYTQYE